MNDHPPECFIVPRQKIARFPFGEMRGRKTPSALANCSPVSTALSGSFRGKRIARDWGFWAARLIHSVSRPSAIGLQPAAYAFPDEEIWELVRWLNRHVEASAPPDRADWNGEGHTIVPIDVEGISALVAKASRLIVF